MTVDAELRAQFCAEKRPFGLRIGDFAPPRERAELELAPAPHRFDQRGIGMVDEIGKRRLFGVFFTHEQQWNIRRQERQPGRKLEIFQRNAGAQAIAKAAIADLIVVLCKDDKTAGRNVARGAPVAPSTKFGILAGVDEAFAIGFQQLIKLAVVAVVPVELSGQERAETVVKIVVPLSIEAVSTALALAHQTRIVVGTLGDQINLPVEPRRFPFHRLRQLFDESDWRTIHDRVYGIDSKRVHVKLADPLERVLNEKIS